MESDKEDRNNEYSDEDRYTVGDLKKEVKDTIEKVVEVDGEEDEEEEDAEEVEESVMTMNKIPHQSSPLMFLSSTSSLNTSKPPPPTTTTMTKKKSSVTQKTVDHSSPSAVEGKSELLTKKTSSTFLLRLATPTADQTPTGTPPKSTATPPTTTTPRTRATMTTPSLDNNNNGAGNAIGSKANNRGRKNVNAPVMESNFSASNVSGGNSTAGGANVSLTQQSAQKSSTTTGGEINESRESTIMRLLGTATVTGKGKRKQLEEKKVKEGMMRKE